MPIQPREELLEKFYSLLKLASENTNPHEAKNAERAADSLMVKLMRQFKMTKSQIDAWVENRAFREVSSSAGSEAPEQEGADAEPTPPPPPRPPVDDEAIPPPPRKKAKKREGDSYVLREIRGRKSWVSDFSTVVAKHCGCAVVVMEGKTYFFGDEEDTMAALQKIAQAIAAAEVYMAMRGLGSVENFLQRVFGPAASLIQASGMMNMSTGAKDIGARFQEFYEGILMEGVSLNMNSNVDPVKLAKSEASKQEWILRTTM